VFLSLNQIMADEEERNWNPFRSFTLRDPREWHGFKQNTRQVVEVETEVETSPFPSVVRRSRDWRTEISNIKRNQASLTGRVESLETTVQTTLLDLTCAVAELRGQVKALTETETSGGRGAGAPVLNGKGGEEPPLECSLCETVLTTEAGLRFHMTIEHRYRCGHCQRRFVKSEALDAHMAQHLCGVYFPSSFSKSYSFIK